MQLLGAALADKYRVVREIGRGGWGVVYLAEDLRDNRQVAIKVLQLDADLSRARQRFLREIDIVKHLDHPNVVPIVDSGEFDGTLYYVMPFIRGETLQQRLHRERQLSIEESLRIAREVAAALAHAHVVGVIHRDVKPANILLDGDRVLVADFGIARAIRQSGNERWVSSSNLALGTPEYMSTEQASGDPIIDGRADVYALGCVLYEMLAGSPPFTGSTASAVLSRHALDPVPSLRTVRASVSPAIENVILRALAKVPADRFATPADMAAALSAAADVRATTAGVSSPRRPLVPSRWLLSAASALVLLVTWVLWTQGTGMTGATLQDVDVIQLTGRSAGGVDDGVDLAGATAQSLAQWRDLRVQVLSSGDVPPPATPLITSGSRDALGSRSVVTVGTERRGDSLVVSVRRVSYAADRPVFDAQLERATAHPLAARVAAQLARRLFAPVSTPDSVYDLAPALTSLEAWREYHFGLHSVNRWDLRAASAHLNRALSAADGFAPAYLWAVQVDAVRDPRSDSAVWLPRARQLERMASALHGRDSLLAVALVHIGRGDAPEALRGLTRLTSEDSTDALVWIDVGIALSRDSAVLRDSRSPTGWRFRSSHADAYRAFMRAVRLDRRVPAALPVAPIASLLQYRPATVRGGRALPPDTGSFFALPALDGDSVVLMPVPRQVFEAGVVPPTVAQAVAANQRQLQRDLTNWILGDSTAADAFRILSELLEVRGDLSGPTIATSATLALERALALEPSEARRLALQIAQLRLHLKLGRFADVRRAAVRLLDESDAAGSRDPLLLRGVAALIGDQARTEQLEFEYSRQPGRNSPAAGDPASVARAWARFTAAATTGPCAQRTPVLLDSLLAAIDAEVAPNERSAAVRRLAVSAAFALPCLGVSAAARVATSQAPLGRMIRALALGDTTAFRREAAALTLGRSGARPADVTPDYALVEAWLLLQAGDTAAATTKLDTQVLTLPSLAPHVLGEASTAGAIGRAMMLRAQLAPNDVALREKWASAAEALLGISSSLARRMSP